MKTDSLEVVLGDPIIFKSVYELITPEDTMKVGEIFKVPFTKVYQCFDLLREGKVLEAAALVTDKPVEEFLKVSANEGMKFIKWLQQEIEKCINLMNNIPSVKDPDLELAGADRLNQIGEFNIYRAITKDPREWDDLGNVRFELMYIKLLGDGLDAVVQHDYNEIIKKKK